MCSHYLMRLCISQAQVLCFCWSDWNVFELVVQWLCAVRKVDLVCSLSLSSSEVGRACEYVTLFCNAFTLTLDFRRSSLQALCTHQFCRLREEVPRSKQIDMLGNVWVCIMVASLQSILSVQDGHIFCKWQSQVHDCTHSCHFSHIYVFQQVKGIYCIQVVTGAVLKAQGAGGPNH
jgi:hypothetical protein